MFQAERIAGTDFEPNLLTEFLRPPFRKVRFTSPKTVAQAAQVLQDIVEPRKTFRWRIPSGHRYFEGTVEVDRFKISRIIRGRNSFLPIIEGTFREEPSGTAVTLNMRMAWPVVVFWSGFIFALLCGLLGSNSVGIIGMILFAYFMATVSFAIEARIATKRLLDRLHSGYAG